ncbi:MAG: MraY family glycosyltransferase [Gammaproteobacteria bacterium]
MFLLIAMVSMAISMAIIPLMMRYASRLGMLDNPDPRKVHAVPIPRVGGVGIVIGALVAMLIWLPSAPFVNSFIFGCVVLLIFGVWDDCKELGHYVKFIGQFIAVIVVVYYGDLYVAHFPYMGLETLPESIGKPFTVIALVGVINALNHSDGLDGLAGGESLLSFGAVAYLAYLYDGLFVLVIACAMIGGIFGFLRFNSHPARVFMGDGGSQVLGFSLGVVVVLLTQEVNPVMSSAIPLLLIGLPIIDILAVFFLRAKGGMNLFRATKNHIHHRLLELGFYHYESVMVIYSIQAFFVFCAILLRYESYFLITAVYLLASAAVFAALTIAERRGSHFYRNNLLDQKSKILSRILSGKLVLAISMQVLQAGVSIFLVGAALTSVEVPQDIAVSAVLLLVILIMLVLVPPLANLFLFRLVAFVSIGFAVYLSTSYPPVWLSNQHYLVLVFFAVLLVAGFLAVRMSSETSFQITPLDYLVVIIAVIISIVSEGRGGSELTWMALQMIALFYASELILQRVKSMRNRVSGALIAMLSLVAARGLL